MRKNEIKQKDGQEILEELDIYGKTNAVKTTSLLRSIKILEPIKLSIT